MLCCHGIPLTIFHCAFFFSSSSVLFRFSLAYKSTLTTSHAPTKPERTNDIHPFTECVCVCHKKVSSTFSSRFCLMPFYLLLLLYCLYNIWDIRGIHWHFFPSVIGPYHLLQSSANFSMARLSRDNQYKRQYKWKSHPLPLPSQAPRSFALNYVNYVIVQYVTHSANSSGSTMFECSYENGSFMAFHLSVVELCSLLAPSLVQKFV